MLPYVNHVKSKFTYCMKRTHYLLVLFALFVSGLFLFIVNNNNPLSDNNQLEVSISSKGNLEKDLVEVKVIDSTLIPNFEKIVKLETTDSCLVARIKKIELDDGFLFILSMQGDKADLFVFDQRGKFLRKIGEQGQGAEEYIKISSFVLDKKAKTVMLIDGMLEKAILFSYDGDYKGEKALRNFIGYANFIDCCLINDELYIYNYLTNMDLPGMTSMNLKTNMITEYFSHEPLRTSGYMDGVNNPIAAQNNQLSFVKFLVDTIYTCTNVGGVTSKYVMKHGKKLIDKSILTEPLTFNNSLRDFAGKYSSDTFKGYLSIHETSNFIYLVSQEGYMAVRYIINKQNNIATYDELLVVSKDPGLPLYIPDFVIDDKFVAIKQCDYLMGKEDIFEPYPEILKVISESQEDDNPCLIFYTL